MSDEEKTQDSAATSTIPAVPKWTKTVHANDMMYRYGGRDLIGYGATAPRPKFPHGGKVALNFVINYEEGGEKCLLHGDAESEKLLSDIVGAASYGTC